MRNIPRLRPGWASVVCLAPMCARRARTKVGACLWPGHKEYVARAEALRSEQERMCDTERYGFGCHVCDGFNNNDYLEGDR